MKNVKLLSGLLLASLMVSIIMNTIDDIGFGQDNVMIIMVTAVFLAVLSLALSLVPIILLNLIFGHNPKRSVTVIWSVWLILSAVNLVNNYQYTEYIQ